MLLLRLFDRGSLASMHDLLLKKAGLIELLEVLTRVDLVIAGLWKWDDKTSAEAAAHQNGHDANV